MQRWHHPHLLLPKSTESIARPRCWLPATWTTVNISGVHFKNFTVQGKAITSQTDSDASWDINSYVSNITFE